jgi:hypothetical protein
VQAQQVKFVISVKYSFSRFSLSKTSQLCCWLTIKKKEEKPVAILKFVDINNVLELIYT